MKNESTTTGNPWQKTQYANLFRYEPSGTYFARIRISGKLIRRSLDTTVLSVAKLRLGDLEKQERQLGLFNTLAKATTRRRQLEITYRKPGQTQVERRVIDPYHLANINGEWYLFAFDHLRHDIRTFVPSRIKSARQTGKTFLRPERFSLDKRLRGSFGVHSAEGEYEVLLRFSPRVADYVREKKWHDSQRLRELRDGGVELRLKLSSLQEVERWVLSWAGDALVLKPKELVESVRRAAQRLLKGHA